MPDFHPFGEISGLARVHNLTLEVRTSEDACPVHFLTLHSASDRRTMYFFMVPAPLRQKDGSGHRALTLRHIAPEMFSSRQH